MNETLRKSLVYSKRFRPSHFQLSSFGKLYNQNVGRSVHFIVKPKCIFHNKMYLKNL